MSKSKLLRFTTVLVVIAVAVLVNLKKTSEKEELTSMVEGADASANGEY